MMLSRRTLLAGMAGVAATAAAGTYLLVGTPVASAAAMTVYRSPTCGCCGAWVDHLRADGFDVTVENHDDLTPIKQRLGVPSALQSCHTGVIDGYVVEGHVPAADLRALLARKPQATGLAVPGMPIGSPGMEQGNRREPYDVVLFGAGGQRSVWAQY